MVEHLVYTERVGGSKPSPPMFIFGPFDFAQDKFLDLRCSTGARAGVSIANFSACTPSLVQLGRKSKREMR